MTERGQESTPASASKAPGRLGRADARTFGDGTLYTRPDLEPISFDDLPLGGEWTTRRRTISEAEIALFAGVAGDFSPLTIDAVHAGARFAPPALLVAVAIGLGSMDMPVPSVAAWEWLNWKFPRPVKAGETIYARWTLTQKRPPVGGAPTAIVVWRVDIHTADGAICAEGEVGASVRREAHAVRAHPAEAVAAAPASRRRRGRRSSGATPKATEAPPPPVEAPSTVAAPAEKTGTARRRRRRRPRSTAAGTQNGSSAAPPSASTTPAADPPPPAPVAASASAPPTSPLSRVIKRLRRS